MNRNPTEKAVDYPIVGSFHEDRITKISSENTINWYEAIHPFGKKITALHPYPGTKFKVNVGTGVHRGAFVFNNFVYFCTGGNLFRMDSSFVVSPLGVLGFASSTGFVDIDANQTQIIFVDGLSGLIFDTNTLTLSVVPFPPGVLPNSVTYMDGYFIVDDTVTNRFYVSNLDTGLIWGALNFALINSNPTFARGVQRLKRRLFIFGTTITEVWLDAGTANFPFRRDNNLLFEHGLEAPGSLVEGFDRMFYLSRNKDGVGSIKMVEGTYPEDISTYELDNLIQTLDDTELAIGLVYKINGIIFYQISLGGRTFIYNVTMSSQQDRKWSEVMMLDKTRHIANTHIFFEGAHFIGSYKGPELYEFSTSFLDNNGESIYRARIGKVISDPLYSRIRIDRLQVDMLQGVGIPGTDRTDFASLNANKDQDPKLKLSISVDGGVTFTAVGDATIGKTGNRVHRTIFRNLGMAYQHVPKIETWNSVPLYILGAAMYLEVEAL